ncbi:MAG: transposase [Bacteroidota bacterium]
MDKSRNFYKDTYHHLYNRGALKSNIFNDRDDYILFLKRLRYYKIKYKIQILVYCLMSNHFHFFVKQITHTHSISNFVSDLSNSYTKSFNKKYVKNGVLFEGRIKSKHITDEHYFKWIIKYILENPVKAKLVENIYDWEFSNAKDLLKLRNGTLSDVEEVYSYFDSFESMKEFLVDKSIKVNYDFP